MFLGLVVVVRAVAVHRCDLHDHCLDLVRQLSGYSSFRTYPVFRGL